METRRHFTPPEADAEFLEISHPHWESIIENSHKWLIIHEFQLPPGYTLNVASVALRIDPGYPNAQIDMAYFSPELRRQDGKVIGALASVNFDGKQWQRWSRHRTGQNPWRPGLDDVSTHLQLVRFWMEQEFTKR